MTGVQAQAGAHQEFPCESCGAKLHFTPGSDQLQCPYCGHSQTIAKPEAGRVEERDLETALRQLAQRPVSELAQGGHEIQCSGCGAITVVTGQASACPFCDSPVVVPIEEDRAMIVPESVLPFAVDQAKAGEQFKEWITSRWFAPNDLADRAKRARMDGVYLPYYTFDAQTFTRYRGERGDDYTVTETYTDSEGNTQTREVTKTRWSNVSGRVSVHFDDVLVCGSTSLPAALVDELEPWDLHDLRPFDPGFLSGFMAERASLDLPSGYEAAKHKMGPRVDQAIRHDIGGDHQRIHGKSTDYEDTTFKLFLLPLWLSSFRYEDQVYRFVVNARTGEATGERPWSKTKIALAIIGGILLIAAIAFLFVYLRGR
ncbi:hypothetical protein G6O69_24550 [Pseudenhygromyxa sp. WMMC2535]|uniref:hypothetical protein n=1 Tax=Pseudenhygromyxa sp. WMMC2535 TaxID=2712867 RepID=UPI001556D3BA|nr:hypothetical protein [Pseudenhygromyxa sp. WMMC2535]NVB41034.1 hypothetical protein [Pseudenhygromyxa sp. WMMC2535]